VYGALKLMFFVSKSRLFGVVYDATSVLVPARMGPSFQEVATVDHDVVVLGLCYPL